jgi:hypothetical protein
MVALPSIQNYATKESVLNPHKLCLLLTSYSTSVPRLNFIRYEVMLRFCKVYETPMVTETHARQQYMHH